MKSRLFIVAAMLGLLATACNKDEVTPQDDMTTKTPITIKANYGNNGSKVSYTESGNTISATWQSGDKLLVIYNNNVNTLDLVDGAGENTATFSGDITGTPSEGAMLVCYVKDQNTPNGTITVNGDGSYIYTSDAFLGQDGTLAGASKLNLYCGWTRYSSSSDISCTFGVNTSMMKFNVSGISADAGESATIAYKSGNTEVAKATFTVAAGDNLIYLTIPAGHYTGNQSLVYTCGGTELSNSLSATQANFTAGQTYSKSIEFFDARNYPLTFEAKTAGSTVTFYNNTHINMTYSLNGGAWTNCNYSGATDITLTNIGDKVSFRADNSTINTSLSTGNKFSGTGQSYIYGNIMSILSSTDYATMTSLNDAYTFSRLFYNNRTIYSHPSKKLMLPATTLTEYCYEDLFYGCTKLTSAPDLPATTLANNCYRYMFSGCSGLTSAPTLPATTMVDHCYHGMFSSCTSLKVAPDLPALTLAQYCYSDMFSGCKGLIMSPMLPATTLTTGCYSMMFSGCTGLTATPDLPAVTLATDCYSNMFNSCTSLTKAPDLPATTLASGCYGGMFTNCTSLTSAPELSATTLASGCYFGMFTNCTSLTTAPDLFVTSLASNCYGFMFQGCTNLSLAPYLPATTLVDNCYQYMFDGCTNLNRIQCLATNIEAYNCTRNWLNGVAATGTFTKASSMSNWTSGANGIPSGWTVNNQ